MLILILLFLLVLLLALLFAIYMLVKWTLKDKIRIKWTISFLLVLVFGMGIKKVFFTKMEFIQSNVYSNLYIVKNPLKDIEERNKAIINEIKVHLKNKHKQTKELSYSDTKSIYFYEYVGASFSFLSEAGTEYFIDHEEDLGGFVSEELGMYQEYRIAEFYYTPCNNDSSKTCGEIGFYHEGELVKADSLKID